MRGEHGPDLAAPRIVAAATSVPPGGTSVRTHALIAGHLAGTGISVSQAGRILADLELRPHKVRGWLNRRDNEQFRAQAAAVCDVCLRPPPDTVVVCIDEKTGIQAKYRKYPGRPARRGRLARREFEYVRNGTVSIIAALHVATGQVIAEPIPVTTRSPSSASCTAWTSAPIRACRFTWSWTTGPATPPGPPGPGSPRSAGRPLS